MMMMKCSAPKKKSSGGFTNFFGGIADGVSNLFSSKQNANVSSKQA